MENNEETINILFNDCYGGFCVSETAIKLYNKKMSKLNPEHINVNTNDYYYFYDKRHDPVLVEVYNELGRDFHEDYSNIKIKVIPKKYEKYYHIQEYDGLENIYIETDKYILDNMRKIIKNNSITNDEKISLIDKILSYR